MGEKRLIIWLQNLGIRKNRKKSRFELIIINEGLKFWFVYLISRKYPGGFRNNVGVGLQYFFNKKTVNRYSQIKLENPVFTTFPL